MAIPASYIYSIQSICLFVLWLAQSQAFVFVVLNLVRVNWKKNIRYSAQ